MALVSEKKFLMGETHCFFSLAFDLSRPKKGPRILDISSFSIIPHVRQYQMLHRGQGKHNMMIHYSLYNIVKSTMYFVCFLNQTN